MKVAIMVGYVNGIMTARELFEQMLQLVHSLNILNTVSKFGLCLCNILACELSFNKSINNLGEVTRRGLIQTYQNLVIVIGGRWIVVRQLAKKSW